MWRAVMNPRSCRRSASAGAVRLGWATLAVIGLASLALGFPAGQSLRIYFIDVEGGQSTLIVTPAGRSLLVDTGWPDFAGRDAGRIVAAARRAHLARIDDVVITHFHSDHVGGVPQLVQRMRVGTFFDHGASVEHGAEAEKLVAAYRAAIGPSRREVVRPGDHIPLPGVGITVLTANGGELGTPLPGAGGPNPYCAATPRTADDTSENARSVGFLLAYGKFRFVDLGDLTWNKELDLMCPDNRVGTASVLLVSHHGLAVSNSQPLVWALRPQVAIMNNGARKGGEPAAWERLKRSPGLEDLWQLHYSEAGGADHNVNKAYIANLHEKCRGHWIELTAEPDGSFTVWNSRNGFAKHYRARTSLE